MPSIDEDDRCICLGCVQLMIIPALESLTLHTGKSLIGHSLFMHNNPTAKALAISVQGGASLTTLTFLRASLSVWFAHAINSPFKF